jgi:hypothetical protein
MQKAITMFNHLDSSVGFDCFHLMHMLSFFIKKNHFCVQIYVASWYFRSHMRDVIFEFDL